MVVVFFQSCRPGKKPEFNPAAVELNNEGVRYVQQFKEDSALSLFDQAIEKDGNYYLPHANKMSIYIGRKQFGKALQESEMILKKDPEGAQGWTVAGMLHETLGDTVTAQKYYQRSISLFDKRIVNTEKADEIFNDRLNRAVSFILSGQEEKGRAELRLLKTEEPENPVVDKILHTGRGELLDLLNGGFSDQGTAQRVPVR
jgi:tetratricopeptide (TPR) repeat protein